MSSITDAHPILPCLNLEETIAFYDKLGFALGNLFRDQYLILHRDGIQLHFWKCNDRKLAESSGCYIRCVDADALHANLPQVASNVRPPKIAHEEFGSSMYRFQWKFVAHRRPLKTN